MKVSLHSCPYCGAELASADANEDHIFVKALGGRAVVRAHETCNSRFGYLVEGKLLKPGEQLNRRVLRGRVEGDGSLPAEVDLLTGDLRLPPVSAVNDEAADTRTYTLRGTSEDVRATLEGPMGAKVGLTREQIDSLIAGAEPLTDPITVVSELSFDIGMAQRLVAKSALGAIGRIAPGFVASPLADDLRAIMWGEQPVVDSVATGALNVVETQVRQLGLSIEPLGPAVIDGGEPPASRAIFMPIASGTAIFVFLRDQLVAFSGILVRSPCPVGSGLPVVVIDAKGGLQTRDIATELATQQLDRLRTD